MPPTLKPVPAALTVVRFSLAVPEFVTVTTCFPLLPTRTLPKEIALGLADNPATLALDPFPCMEIFVGEFLASLTIENVPAVSPVTLGVNCSCIVSVPPAAREPAGLVPTTLKPVPENSASETTTDVVPPFVSFTVSTAWLPTATWPKSTVAALKLSVPEGRPAPTPQPKIPTKDRTAAAVSPKKARRRIGVRIL